MAVSKSYNRNQPIGGGFSNAKAYFSMLQNPSRTLWFNTPGNETETDKYSLIGGLPNQLFYVFTQPNSHFVKTSFDENRSRDLHQLAENKINQGQTNQALTLLHHSLLNNPENVEARLAYSRLLAETGKHTEALEHYRLAIETRRYNNQRENKKISFLNPLLLDHAVSWQFEPAHPAAIQAPASGFLSKITRFARAACLAATIAFSGPFTAICNQNGQSHTQNTLTPANDVKSPLMAKNMFYAQDTKTLEGRVLNMSGDALKNSSLTLNTPSLNQTTSDNNGYYRFDVTDFPTGIKLDNYDRGVLQPGAIKVEFIDLLGRAIDNKQGYLNQNGEIENIDSNVSGLLQGGVYIQRITDKTGNSISKKFVNSDYRPALKEDVEAMVKGGLKSAETGIVADTFAYKAAAKPDLANVTYKDTVFNFNGFLKSDLYHYEDFFVNEFVKIADAYKNGLDTIVNSTTVEFDMTKLFKDDNYNKLSFSFTNGFENYVSIDTDNKKIILDRSKAPLKGNFEIFADDVSNNKTAGLNISYNENAMEFSLIAKNSVTSELLDEADIYIDSFSNHLKLSDLIKDQNGFVRLYAKSGQTNVVRVDGEKYGFADALSKSDTIRAFVAPADFPMAFYNDLNRDTGIFEVVKWEEGKQLTMKVLKSDAGTGLPLPESKYKELGEFGLTLEKMMKEKGINDTPFSNMKVEYVSSFGGIDNTIEVYFESGIPASGFIGFSYKDVDPQNYVNLRHFIFCGVTINYPMNEINTFKAKLQEYMSIFYGRGPPRDEIIPTDGSLFAERNYTSYLTNSDVKIIKHHINQQNGSWYALDTGKNIGIEITKDAAKKNKVNELVPKLEYFR
jgi:hypothetical protein